MFQTTSQVVASPESFVTKGKQRLKQHNNTVYLKDGDEFEIELFNPTSYKVLAKLELNGNYIGSGIVLRPGERVFLERYLDESKKFLFDTYFVNGSNSDVKEAIKKNGKVRVEFFWENVLSNISPTVYFENYPKYHTYTDTTSVRRITNPTTNYSTLTTSVNSFYSNSSNTNVGSTLFTSSFNPESSAKSINNVETGRIEKGSESTQKLVTDNSSFWVVPFKTITWDILPLSQKMVTREDLKVFCVECGSKRKKDSHKFCPHCGTKY